MDYSHIQFYEEKKEVITNILDTAVKKLDFNQNDYVDTKAQLMQIIESPGNERVGIGKVVTLANQMIAKVAHHSGYIIVDRPELQEVVEPLVADTLEPETDKVEADAAQETAEQPMVFRQASVALSQKKKVSKARDPSTRGKETLLKLMNFLPPLIPQKEIELMAARVRMANLGPYTGSVPSRTTGDLEREMVNQVRDEYAFVLSDLIRSHPAAFIEQIEMASGRIREEDISEKLRKQLTRVNSLAEFLSVKDLVDRHIKAYEEAQKGRKTNAHGLFFWRKK